MHFDMTKIKNTALGLGKKIDEITSVFTFGRCTALNDASYGMSVRCAFCAMLRLLPSTRFANHSISTSLDAMLQTKSAMKIVASIKFNVFSLGDSVAILYSTAQNLEYLAPI